MSRFLGIDTSCYTTSLAVIDESLNVIEDLRLHLKVPTGEKGLRQSDGVFMHIKNLSNMLETLEKSKALTDVAAVSASLKPGCRENSYMPVFLAGETVGKAVAAAKNIKFYGITHQQGHILAAYDFFRNFKEESFLAMHISGGTTELLKVDGYAEKIKKIGGTLDLNIGQLIDRTGVMLGLDFPAGKELDLLSQNADKPCVFPLAVKETYINFSGAENKIKEAALNNTKENIAAGLFIYAAKAFEEIITFANKKYEINTLLFVGGVSANTVLRQKLNKIGGVNVFFADVNYSSDNALGAAFNALYEYKKR